MYNKKISSDRQFYHQILIKKLKEIISLYPTQTIYIEERASKICSIYLNQTDFISIGISIIYKKQTIKLQQKQNIIILCAIDQSSLSQIQKYLYLFQSVYILNLNTISNQIKQSIKVSPLRKKLKGFIEINLNFVPFIDRIYISHLNEPKKQQQISFKQSLISYLVSFNKFYQYQIFTYNKHSPTNKFGEELKTSLQQQLKILQNHKYPNYSQQKSSPRIKVVIIPRQIDKMSPLAYIYHYGAIYYQIANQTKQMRLFDIKSKLFNTLFSMDFQQSQELLKNLNSQKQYQGKILTNIKKQQTVDKIKSNQFQNVKQAIFKYFDQNNSLSQLLLRNTLFGQIKQFCKKRSLTTSLQQTIINMIDQQGKKMKAGFVVDRVVKWSQIPLQQLKPSYKDYMKILILSYMVNSFWFFHRRIINSGIQNEQKDKIINFCKKIEGSCKPLKQKQQSQQRYDLFRLQPGISRLFCQWMQGRQLDNFNLKQLNKTINNRQSKVILVIPGPVGYGQLSYIKRQFQKKNKNYQISVFCERIVKTNQYMQMLINEQKY